MNLSQRAYSGDGPAGLVAPTLDAAVAAVATARGATACWAFVEDAAGQLVLGAARPTAGCAGSDQAMSVALGLAGQAVTRMSPESAEGHPHSLLGVPMMFRGRALGALVLQSKPGHLYAPEEIRAVMAAAAQVAAVVEGARLREMLDPPVHGAPPSPSGEQGTPAVGAEREQVLTGLAASPGLAMGMVVFRGVALRHPEPQQPASRSVEEELALLRDALQKTRNDIQAIQSAAVRQLGEEHAEIFRAHLVMLEDAVLLARLQQGVGAGIRATGVVDAAFREIESRLRAAADPYLREKAEDTEDLRSRIRHHLMGSAVHPSVVNTIVVATRVAPSLLVEMMAQGARGLITATGSATSHGILLAKAMGIPVVTGIQALPSLVRVGDVVVVDGTHGQVTVHPGAATRIACAERIKSAHQARTEHARYCHQPCQSADGVRVALLANVGLALDLTAARDNGAEGIGLYRTEIPFMVRDAFPSLDEQVHIYRKAFEAFPRGPVTFRLLDLAGDKFVRTGGPTAARSAFHGYRSIRVLFDHPHVLREQVQAFALAAAGAPLSILIPMVTSMEELRRARALITQSLAALGTEQGLSTVRVGAMIEVPAAVELAEEMAAEVDFLSLGTNDLVQYTLVADREDPRMCLEHDAFHPAILRMITRVIAAAHRAGRPLGVCGEMAAEPCLAAALVALGVDMLSVVPNAIPGLKQALAHIKIGALARSMDRVVGMAEARQVHAALRALVPTETPCPP